MKTIHNAPKKIETASARLEKVEPTRTMESPGRVRAITFSGGYFGWMRCFTVSADDLGYCNPVVG